MKYSSLLESVCFAKNLMSQYFFSLIVAPSELIEEIAITEPIIGEIKAAI